MTQSTDTAEVLKQLGKLTILVEGIQTDVQDIKLNQARTDERLKALETQVSDFKKSTETQIADLKKSTETQITDLRKSTETQIADLRKSTETQITDIRLQLRSQGNRLWSFLVALFLAVLGLASQQILFPNHQA
ncbi:MAG: hypothetical protein IGS54_02160 [Elainella sp. C42_A2020_010]|nr:hypothetical protein [Elainella sp. C42_A2020_010]